MAASGTHRDTVPNILPLECVRIACDLGMVADRVRLPMGAPQTTWRSSIAANAPPCLGGLRGFESLLRRQTMDL